MRRNWTIWLRSKTSGICTTTTSRLSRSERLAFYEVPHGAKLDTEHWLNEHLLQWSPRKKISRIHSGWCLSACLRTGPPRWLLFAAARWLWWMRVFRSRRPSRALRWGWSQTVKTMPFWAIFKGLKTTLVIWISRLRARRKASPRCRWI